MRENHSEKLLVYVDIDDCPIIQDRYGAYSVPMVVAFVNGRAVDRFIGSRDDADIQAFLAQVPASQ